MDILNTDVISMDELHAMCTTPLNRDLEIASQNIDQMRTYMATIKDDSEILIRIRLLLGESKHLLDKYIRSQYERRNL